MHCSLSAISKIWFHDPELGILLYFFWDLWKTKSILHDISLFSQILCFNILLVLVTEKFVSSLVSIVLWHLNLVDWNSETAVEFVTFNKQEAETKLSQPRRFFPDNKLTANKEYRTPRSSLANYPKLKETKTQMPSVIYLPSSLWVNALIKPICTIAQPYNETWDPNNWDT